MQVEYPGVTADQLVRVDEPDYPGAIATSERGSVLIGPPADPGVAWRPEPVPVPDRVAAALVADTGGEPGVAPTTPAWEALEALGVARWRQAHPDADGRGVKLAIFDLQWYQHELYANTLGDYETHDCWVARSCEPPIDGFRPHFSFEASSHGVACAEVVRAIAPAVELHLVRVNGLTTLENAVEWAVREHIDLVSMSLSFFNESFYDGTGAVNEAATKLADGGVLLVNSSGNYARQHYSARFRDPDGDSRHNFPWGSEYLPIYLPAGRDTVYLSWDDFRQCGNTDLDAYVYAADGTLVGRSTNAQTRDSKSCVPIEQIGVTAASTGWYYLLVYHAAGSTDTTFKVLLRSGVVYHAQAAGSITDPGSAPTVFTVGAVRAKDYLFNGPEYFSSQGPTQGGLAKPDIAGPDGLTSSIYGPSGFYGTSAAAPAVAAAIADVMSADPGIDARSAADRLATAAVSDRATWQGPDGGLGAGRARLPTSPTLARGCGGTIGSLPALLWFPLASIRRRVRGGQQGRRYSDKVLAR